MRNTLYILISLFGSLCLSAQTIVGNFTEEKSNTSIKLIVNTDDGLVKMEFTGPSDVWYAFGFGSKVMKGAYAIAVSDRGIEERFLDGRNEGETLNKSIRVLSDTTVNGFRKVEISRLLKGKGDKYYNFPRSASDIDIIYAIGKNEKVNKKHAEKGTAVLKLR